MTAPTQTQTLNSSSTSRVNKNNTPLIRKLFLLGFKTPFIAEMLDLKYHEVNLYIQLQKREGLKPLPPGQVSSLLNLIPTNRVLEEAPK